MIKQGRIGIGLVDLRDMNNVGYAPQINGDKRMYAACLTKKPEIHHNFVNILDRIAPEAQLYRKSGS